MTDIHSQAGWMMIADSDSVHHTSSIYSANAVSYLLERINPHRANSHQRGCAPLLSSPLAPTTLSNNHGQSLPVSTASGELTLF